MKNLPPYNRSYICFLFILLAGCANVRPPVAPESLVFDRLSTSETPQELNTNKSKENSETGFHRGPKTPEFVIGNIRSSSSKEINTVKSSGNLTVSLEQVSINSFIHAVYGGILKLNYSIDASILDRKDLVTFRVSKPISEDRLFDVAAQLLKSYGISVQNLEGVVRITVGTSIASTLPMILRGRAQPTVPQPLRPIFNYIETEAVKPESFFVTLKSMLGDRVKVEVTQLGGLLLSGQPDDVQSALELIQVFDQPSLRGQNNIRIVPRFWGAEDFSRRLAEVLRAEGYGVGMQTSTNEPITILPLVPINSVLIFASNKDVLSHAIEWAKELDQLNAVQAGGSLFTYSVKNTDAKELARSLNDLITGEGSIQNAQSASTGNSSSVSAAPNQKRVVVNAATNSLIFQGGSQEDYRQWLSLLVELDKPTKSALIDVLVAEVTLKNENDLGFAWKLDQLGSGAQALKLSGTTYSLDAGSSGLAINALLGGNPLRQLAINALASSGDSRVISNPKLITKNGETANINVGEEVPTVTSQAVTDTGGIIGGSTSIVPQTVQYRNTGIILKVRPVIHSGDRIDIEVNQEVSSAEPTVTGVTTSPTIRKRSVDTKISLKDGATIMLGGLISETNSNSDSGVPFLKDIPVFGNFFKSSKRSSDRTELVILITPYILNDSSDAESATDAYNSTLGVWADSVRERVRRSRDAQNKISFPLKEGEMKDNKSSSSGPENIQIRSNFSKNEGRNIELQKEEPKDPPGKMISIRKVTRENPINAEEVFFEGDTHLSKHSFTIDRRMNSSSNESSLPEEDVVTSDDGKREISTSSEAGVAVKDPELLKEIMKSLSK